ncbi:MAG: helix-turn-helix transcriptional regulator [Clostridia bacterium]|nr:helix-turn-helix transcriptional regulator [Clostridia bacterium]
MNFGEKLKNLRRKNKLTQAQLAEKIGVSVRMIIKYEHGESYPRSREIYARLADILEVPVNYLLTEDDDNENEAQKIINRAAALFEGGGLNEADKLAFIHQMQELYLKSVEK